MSHSILNPADTVELQNRKLIQIVDVLMRRVEQATGDHGAVRTQLQRPAIGLECMQEHSGRVDSQWGASEQVELIDIACVRVRFGGIQELSTR